jgi:glyoxylase-like metal-dependent hydrolase (beta-lactamase superfamily II)
MGCSRLPIEDGWSHGNISQVKDLFTSTFVVEYEDGVVLIDAGYDEEAKPILSYLETKNKSSSDVLAIFYTHGHRDHIAGRKTFSNAQTYALSAERELIEEEGGTLDIELENQNIMTFGSTNIEVISVVGHTSGNAVYLVNDVLIMGDSAQARRDGTLESVADKYSDNPTQAANSIEELGIQLEPRKDEISWTVFSHSGPLRGIDALLNYRSE